jgi:hypothetical protein
VPRKRKTIRWEFTAWIADTRRLSIEARAIWFDMLYLMDQSPRRGYLCEPNGKPVTAERLAQFAGCSTDVVSRVLQELDHAGVYSTSEEFIYSRRMVRDERRAGIFAANGRKGGRPPQQNQGKPKPNQTGTKTEPHGRVCFGSNSNRIFGEGYETDPASKGRSGPAPAPEARASLSKPSPRALAEQIYQEYPRKAGKGLAIKAILQALEKVPFDELLAAVREFAATPKGRDRQFCPYPATWFSQERWNDDRSEWERAASVGEADRSAILRRNLERAGDLFPGVPGGDAGPVCGGGA